MNLPWHLSNVLTQTQDYRYLTYLVRVSRLILLPGETDVSTPCNRRAQLLQITNYGVPMSFEYIIWSLPVCIPNFLPDTEDFAALGIESGEYLVLLQSLMVIAVQCFFAHQIYHLCRPRVKWWVTAPVILSVVVAFGFGMGTLISAHRLVNNQTSVVTQMTVVLLTGDLFYGVIPAVTVGALAEILITILLCILLYDRRSNSALSRTKRLLNTLIIYAVNRCLLIFCKLVETFCGRLIVIASLVMTLEGPDTWFQGFSFVAGRSSLNSRGHLRSQSSGTPPDLLIGVGYFANPPTLLGDFEILRVEQGKEDVIDIAKYAVPDGTAKLWSEGKVEFK
ncbi:hypothetical protein EDD17DRAFT_1512819 [Pisolithus thermaeus]|nr:hypothetical protein EV401DRAFT_1895476 [Pisolithus croceorrhizus]KAI6154503.1 hypothetical protein EDD17DRAFT_1512819 [Pisolithus thermaeus]